MAKSIEDIWKTGFGQDENLSAPEIKDLYNQKSVHIIDTFKRMFRINLIAIVVFVSVFLVASFFLGIPWMGIIMFVSLIVYAAMNKRLLDDLEQINPSSNSLEYLKSVRAWIAKNNTVNGRASRFLYPIIFMSVILGFWFVDDEGTPLGMKLMGEVLYGIPDATVIFGVPLIVIGFLASIVALLAFFGDKFYRWDVNLIYGRIFKKIEAMISDLESLNE